MPGPKSRKPHTRRPNKRPPFGNKKPNHRPVPAPVLPQHQGYHQGYHHNEPKYPGKHNGRFIAAGCTSAVTEKLFLAEMHLNQTHDIYLRVGYFGGCLSVANLTTSVSTTNTSSNGDTRLHCVTNLRTTDPEDQGEELWEDLHLPAAVQTAVQDALNTTLPYVSQLQRQVFFWLPPVLHAVTFFVSGVVLIVASTAPSQRTAHKLAVLGGAVLSAFALALSLTAAVGTTQTLNSLLLPLGGGSEAKSSLATKVPVYIRRGDLLNGLQNGLLAVVSMFYLLIGALFVRRRE